jgi:hypothetical protein
VYGEACGSAPRPESFRATSSCATTIHNNRGILDRVEELFRLKYLLLNAVTLNND